MSRGIDMEQASGVGDLAGRIYDAAVEPGLWSDVIAEVVEAVGCRSGVFYEHDMATRQSRPFGFHRFDSSFMHDYEAYYGALDPWNARVLSWPVGVAAPTYMLMPDDEFRGTEFYQDYLRLTGVFYGLGGVVERSRGRMAVFGVQCSYEDGRFSSEALALIGGLMPHLRRAYRIQTALDCAERDRASLEDTLHLIEKPVLIVEPDGDLVFANRAAEILLRRREGLTLSRGHVVAAHRDDRTALARAIASEAGVDHAPETIALRRPQPGRGGRRRPYIAWAAPLPRNDTTGARRVALVLETPATLRRDLGDLAAAFRLSAAETRLWSALVAGQKLAEISAETEVSVNTLRVQLAALFRKVGVNRQADLVRLALEHSTPHA